MASNNDNNDKKGFSKGVEKGKEIVGTAVYLSAAYVGVHGVIGFLWGGPAGALAEMKYAVGKVVATNALA